MIHPLGRVRGAIKQWMTFVKPNYELYVEPQKKNAGRFRAFCMRTFTDTK
jgi:uridine kinase